MTNTTRLGLTYPAVAGTSTADVPTDMQTIANQLDTLAVVYSAGTFAARPAASAIAGKIYWATDYKRNYYSDGTSWYDLSDPVGKIVAYPSVTPPDATWLYCDGSSLLRATYPALFGLVGVTFGSVDGTHFTLPDLRGRSVFGMDPGLGRIATDPHAIASAGGSERITLAGAESGIQAHTTQAETADHIHSVVLTDGTPGGSNTAQVLSGVAANFGISTGGRSASHTHAVSAAAASSSHENMPPYMTLAWMIKS